MHFKLDITDVSIVLYNSVLICEFEVSPPAEQQSWCDSQLEARITLTGTEYGKQVFVEPTKSVTNSVLLAQLQKVPPNDITSLSPTV